MTTSRTALVTGGAQGIGYAVVHRLADEGWHVVALDRDAEALRELQGEAAQISTVCCDLADVTAIENAWREIVHHGIDLLVNNAGLTHVKSLWELTLDDWEAVVAVNQRAVFWLSRLAGAHMRDRGWGRIVNLASLAGQTARPSGVHYGATKGAVIALTRLFALELASSGVTVNAVAPGVIETPMIDALSADMLDALKRAIPVGRLGQPEDVAAAVSFLASDQAGFVTGATLDLNGGVLMR
jgi:3-oxoacyl-[acyl-carrier protein] reductase